mgnify:CR=1 FL=1
MHLIGSRWKPIREVMHKVVVLAITTRTSNEPRVPGSLRASRVADMNGASQHLARRAPGLVGSPSASTSATAFQASVCPECHEASASSTPLSAVVLSHDF